MTNPTHGQPIVQPDDIVARIDALIPADEVHSHPLVWRARNVDLALLIDARNEIRALRLENEALRRANASMVSRAEHARVVGDLTREAERLRARVAELSDLVGYIAGRDSDNVSVMLAGNPDACDRLIERARDAKLREALEFYALPQSWKSTILHMCGHRGDSRATLDRGAKARAALEAKP
jgi:hypothetical protein